MINVSVDEVSLKEIKERLGAMRSKAPVLLKKSVNEVAQQMLRDVKKDVKAEYRIGQKAVSEEIYLKGKPNVKTPQISLIARSKQHGIMDFEVTPKTYNIRRKKAIRASQLKSEPLKSIEVGGRKAFIGRFSNQYGKTDTYTVMQRKGKDRFPIKKINGSSMPTMVYKVWKEKEKGQDYAKRLRQAVEKHINEVMGG